ncbi:MAG: Gfo/Idh/MocA family protein [Pirellulales bacterium]
MPEKIPVAIITHAQGAHLGAYFQALAAAPEVESVVLADPDLATQAAAEKALGTRLKKTYRDIQQMLREARPTMALVSMEAAQAPPAIDAALEAGCHVFAEKPACVEAEDFAKLLAKADSKHLQLMLALANRLHPAVAEARRLIQESKLGHIYGINAHIIADQTRLTRPEYHQSWFASKAKAGGGHLIWLGIHWLDLMLYMTGQQVRDVTALTGVVGGQPIDVEDAAAVALRLNGGALATLMSGYFLDRGYHSHIQIWGERGWLRMHVTEELPLEWYSTADSPAGETPQVQRFEIPAGDRGYSPFVRAAVRACAGLQPPPITGTESLHVLQTIFAGYTAASTGQTQHLA